MEQTPEQLAVQSSVGAPAVKRPAFQFYPADWRKDAALQSCSIAAQGLWINILCIAHQCEPYGHLTINRKPMNGAQIGRLVGLSAKECDKLIAELEEAGVASRTDEGALFSRRMVRDECVRNKRANGGEGGKEYGALGAEHGKKGGRPPKARGVIYPPSEPQDLDGRGVIYPPLKPPPSSSSSSSTSIVLKNGQSEIPEDWKPDAAGLLAAAGLDLAAELLAFRSHHVAKGSARADWQAAWQSWIATGRKFVKAAPGGASAQVSDVWHESAAGVDRMAAELGLPPIDMGRFESRPDYRVKVMAAAAKPQAVVNLSQLSAMAVAHQVGAA